MTVRECRFVTDNFGFYVYSSGGNILVYGGDYTSNSETLDLFKLDTTNGTTASITVYGGNYDGGLPDNLTGDKTLTIYGGKFTERVPSQFLPSGYTQDVDGDIILSNAVAEVNGVRFSSLQDAMGMATNDEKIVLLCDITTNITANNTTAYFSFDLNGFKITGGSGSPTLNIVSCNRITIYDSSGDNSGEVVAAEGQNAIAGEFGRLTIYGGTYRGGFGDIAGGSGIQVYDGRFDFDPNSFAYIGNYMAVVGDDDLWYKVPSVTVTFEIALSNEKPKVIEIPAGTKIDPSDIPELPQSGEGYEYIWTNNYGDGFTLDSLITKSTHFTALREYTFTVTADNESASPSQKVNLHVEGVTYTDDVRFDFSWFMGDVDNPTLLKDGENLDTLEVTGPGKYTVLLTIRQLQDAQSPGGGMASITIDASAIIEDDGSVSIHGDNPMIDENIVEDIIQSVPKDTDDPVATVNIKGSSLKLDISSAERIVNSDVTLVISNDTGSMTLSSQVTNSMISQGSEDDELEIRITEATHGDLSDAQQSTVSNRPVFELSATIGDNPIHRLGGPVSIRLTMDISGYNADAIVVYYVDDRGNIEAMPTDCSSGFIVFQTTHFSHYFVGERATAPENPITPPVWEDDDDRHPYIPPTVVVDNGSDDENVKVAACAAAAVLAALVATFLIMDIRRK